MIDFLTSKLNRDIDLKRVKQFINANSNSFNPVVTEAFKQTIENININIRWTDLNMNKLKETLINWSNQTRYN